MSLRAILHAFLFSMPLLLMAQSPTEKVKVKVRISTDDAAKGKLQPMNMLASSASHLMILRSGEFDARAFGSTKTWLELYDRKKLTFIRSVEPGKASTDGSSVLLDGLEYFAGGPMLMGHSMDGDGVGFHYLKLDPGLSRPPGVYEPLVSWEGSAKDKRAVVVNAGGAVRTAFATRVSSDSTHMMLCSPGIKNKETGKGIFFIAMVDRDMNVKWKHTVELIAGTNKSTVEAVELDNAGNAFVVVSNEIERTGEKNKYRYEWVVYTVSASGVNIEKIDVGDDHFATSATLRHLQNGKVACVGLYSAKTDKDQRKLGNFVSLFGPGTTVMGKSKLMPFKGGSAEAGDEAEGEEGESTPAIGGRSIQVLDILPGKAGGFYLVNEQFYSYEYYDAQAKRHVTKYVHGSLQVRCLEESGSERWSTVFRRTVSSGSPLIGNVFCAEFQGQLFLFMLDSEEMAERRNSDAKFSRAVMKNMYSAYVAFDDKGGFKVRSVLKSDKNSDYISGWEMVRTGPGEYFALGTEKLIAGRFLPVRIEFSKDE